MDPTTTSVTGVLVTGKTIARYWLARQAVAAWVAQDYPGPRQLLIVNDHSDQALFRDRTLPPNVFEVRVRETGNSLGRLRNIGQRLAQADYIVQWDDDDHSAPNRLSWQVANTPEEHCSIFKYEIHCNFLTGQGFANCGRSIRCGGFPGTMLYPAHTSCVFPDKGKAEDTEFVLQLADVGDVTVLDNPAELYVRFYHGENTWSEKHVMNRKPGSRDLNASQTDYLRDLLTRYKHAQLRG
jgi:glycosyltransferase involved in cell wall biosynthesis